MKDAFKYGLLAIGAYLLAKQFGVIGTAPTPGPNTPPATQPGGNQTTPPPPASPPPASPPPASSNTTGLTAQLIAAAGGNAFNYDVWGFYYRQITGTPAPSPESVGIARVANMPLMSAAQFTAAVGGNNSPSSTGWQQEQQYTH